MNNPTEKITTTFMYREDLDTNPYLEEMLIEESQNKILYSTLFYTLLILLLIYLAW